MSRRNTPARLPDAAPIPATAATLEPPIQPIFDAPHPRPMRADFLLRAPWSFSIPWF